MPRKCFGDRLSLVPLFKHRGGYLGGGLVNNVPASSLKEYGSDYVISINIGEGWKGKKN